MHISRDYTAVSLRLTNSFRWAGRSLLLSLTIGDTPFGFRREYVPFRQP